LILAFLMLQPQTYNRSYAPDESSFVVIAQASGGSGLETASNNL